MNILLTSAGRRSYLVEFFKAAHEGITVHAANSSPFSPALAIADKAVISPLIYDENYINFLLDYCTANKIDLIVPLFDIDLPVLAAHRELFLHHGTRILVSSPEVVETCSDKWKTYTFLLSNGFSHPHTYISLESAKAALAIGEITFPLIIKPRWGMGSIALFEANSMRELEVLYEKSRMDIERSYLKYESRKTPEHAVIIQEKLFGHEYGLDIINDLDGNYQNTIVKHKFAMRAGETDCAKIVDDLSLKELGRMLAIKMRHIANMDMDVIVCQDSLYILDLNARFGGGYPFTHMAGVNLPKAIILWTLGLTVDKKELLLEKLELTVCKDMRMLRL